MESKYIIYGINRVAKDFLYIFDNLPVEYIADETADEKNFCGIEIISVEEMLAFRVKYKIIICDFEKADKQRVLEENGLIYKKDYFWEEDFFEQLDELKIPTDRKIAVWGIGNACKLLMQRVPDLNTAVFIDSRKTADAFRGIPVRKPDEIADWSEYFVIVAVVRDDEITSYLKERELKESTDYVSYQRVIARPSLMLQKTIFDRACYDLDCQTMLNHLEVLHNGNTRCCCTTFVSENLDNIFEKNEHDLWHSNLHKVMCLSTENRTYSFCDKTMCPLFVGKQAGIVSENNLKSSYKKMSDKPETLAVGYDSTCNLCCETCRKELHHAKGVELETVNRITQCLKQEYVPDCRFLILAGDGEVFLSKAYREIYEDCNPDYIRLLSNGMLLNENTWKRFMKGKTGEIMLTVSIDAATKESYEKIRRNGNFDILKKNMEYASGLRKTGELSYFRLNFVVQRENYREMPAFVQWGEQLGVDEIFFTKILNWGTYSEEEFAKVSMMEADGVTPKAELQQIIDSPVIKNSKIVDLGTIRYRHKNDRTERVKNYYMWELEKRGGKLFEL